ncbi:MAG: hypothetical protein AAB553_05175 [Patescibacteria group bacterium]
MTKNVSAKEWLRNNGNKLKKAYSYAVIHKLDIKSKDDVLTILQATDPENATKEQVEIYSKMLQMFRERFRKTVGGILES